METENLSSNLKFFSLRTDSSPFAFAYPKKELHPNPADFSFEKVQKTEVNAAQLGLYSIDQIKQKGLKALSLQDFFPISQGSVLNGQYSSRVIYLENGTLAQEYGSSLIGRFIINQNYRVEGQPSQSNQNSVFGQFPVNGQYYFQGSYPDQVPLSSNRVLNGQYATSNRDVVNQQFSVSGIVNAQGAMLESGPFFISKSELLNGGYQVKFQNLQGATLQIGGQNVQVGSVKTEQGQLLVNGINSIEGLIRPLNQFTQKATLLIDGRYDPNGTYVINGVTLENGINQITARYHAGNTQGTSIAFLQGRYTSGGQYVVSYSDQTVSNNASNTSSLSQFETIQKRLQETFNAYTRPLPGKILQLDG